MSVSYKIASFYYLKTIRTKYKTMTSLRISTAQYDIVWEDKTKNLQKIKNILLEAAGKTDLVILPEMCTTGFSMNVSALAETIDEETLSLLKKWAGEFDLAICGSFIAKETTDYYNRGFFITSNNILFYDKRHLFRMGDEPLHYNFGNNKLIVKHKGFNICLLICYDLRFPVWARNRNNEYDLLIYVANWPVSRIKVWNVLLAARAIENMSYVCGVNRIGKDGLGLEYNGNSKILDFKGNTLLTAEDKECTDTFELSLSELNKFREKFPVWKDADNFKIL